MVLVDRATGQRRSFSFFNNVILGSKTIPYEVEADEIVQYILIDLPSGEYELVSVSFAFLSENASSSAMHELVEPKLVFTVAESTNTYVGRLNIEIEKILVKGLLGTRTITFPMTESMTTRKTIENLHGGLRFTVENRLSDDLPSVIDLYPGVGTIAFSTDRLR